MSYSGNVVHEEPYSRKGSSSFSSQKNFLDQSFVLIELTTNLFREEFDIFSNRNFFRGKKRRR